MNCAHIPFQSYRRFISKIDEASVSRRIPVNGAMEVTFRCNLKCSHCYCAIEPASKELSLGEIQRIIGQLVQEGCLWLLISGGEPLVRKDFLDIYSYAKRIGLLVILFTNATLINKEIAEYFREWKPFLVEVTLYGATKETYEKVTNVKGSFEKCINGIEALASRKIPLKLKTTLTKINKGELGKMRKYARKMGLEFRFDPVINPKLDGSKEPCKLRISPEELVKLELEDKKRVKAWKSFLKNFSGQPLPEYLFSCGGGLNSFNISPYGELQLCVLFRRPSFDLRTGSFKSGWEGFLNQFHLQKFSRDNRCSGCNLFLLCDQCPGWGQVENDNPALSVNYLCDIAKVRKDYF